MRFYRDHQVAHELSNRAASSLQGAFIEDHEGMIDAAMTYYGQAVTLLRSTVEQWDLVLASSCALQTFLPGKLRPEFVHAMASLDIDALIRELELGTNCPKGFDGPYREAGRIVSGGNDAAVIRLFAESDSKIGILREINQQILTELIGLRSAVARGHLWDVVVPRALLQARAKHRLIDLDEKYFAALMSHAFFLEAISQMSRAVLIELDIPYEECSPKRQQA